VLNQFPRDSKLVSRLPCEDVPIFLEEFDEREFLFGIQIISYVSNLRRLLRGQRNHLTECVLWLDGCLGGLGHGHDLVWGGTRPRLDSPLEALRMPSVCQFSRSSPCHSQKPA
jgi:hypothetical protein